MDPALRQRVHDDLKGVVKGELLFDDLSRTLYSTDASLFEIEPLGVVVPRDEEDVQALVRYAGENQASLIARGAGAGLAGESLGAGIIVDFSRHFRSILEESADTIRVQPGVVYRDLTRRLAASGRRFASQPAHGECTVGGMAADNASGPCAFHHGYMRDHVQSLRVVLDDGSAATVGRTSRWPPAEGEHGRLQDVISSVVTLLGLHAEVIRDCQPRTRFNRCGYLLHDVLDAEHLDLVRLLVGSEGTLGLFTEIVLRTIPLPAGRSAALLGFASLDAALRAAQTVLLTGLTACELMDRRLLRLARGDAAAAALIPTEAEALLLVEYEADGPGEARALAFDLIDRVTQADRPPLALASSEADEIDLFWRVREAALSSLAALRGTERPTAVVEDVAVPTEALPEYLRRVQDVLQRREMVATYLISAATGQVDMRPFLDLRRREDGAKLWALADEVYDIVLELGGTISSRNGTGLARSPWVSRQFGRLYPVFRELKAVFDPRRVFNPGKIVGPVPGALVWPLRRVEDEKFSRDPTGEREDPIPISKLQLLWQSDEAMREAVSCNGCGQCRTESPAMRMCPIFRATHEEAATPRAKANLMRRLLQPDADPTRLASDEVRAVADLCVNCKMCAVECPAHVNIPRLMLEAKAANTAQHGLDRSDWAMARSELFARLGSAFAPLTNALLSSRTARWLLEKLVGLSSRRRLPAFARRSFLRDAWRRGWTRRPRAARPRVAYFVDVFANYNDPSIAEAVTAVLHHNGVEVYVPPDQVGCGMAPMSYGDVDAAREAVQHNLHLLADLAREGWPILCSEPTAAVMLRHDALDLLDDPDARLVASQVVECTAFLWDLHQEGRLKTDFRPLNLSVGHHVPCHLKALGRPPAGPELLRLIPGLRVHTIDVNCSGMAGTFGLKAANYAVSLTAGRPMLEEMSRPRVLFGSTECSTCRMQIEDGAGKRTLHPVQYLALAYGLMPELAARLKKPIRGLVLS
ncbi:MAG TPA: anaerobic glycerol-3-phosphate dehydrogenase subunit C [Planctomycetales bacterium]|nr:anaerobic glycerol-3-phosphate dehydrogenase subunit C [Planctomycetales bacterium]